MRGPRLGHVHVDLAQIRDTAAVDAEDPIDLAALDWPEPRAWIARVSASPLVTAGDRPAAAGEVRPLRLVGSWLYLDRYWAEEVGVARSLRAMAAGPPSGVNPALLQDGLARLFGADASDRQAQAAAAAVTHRWSVVAGGPGTGKTTTVARIVALLCEQAAASAGAVPLVALAAPTGKAAARLQESVHAEAATLDVTPEVRDQLLALRASTIHRLLGWRPGSNSRFRHDRNQRLAHDVVIVDETSMVSLSLMARLIEALRSGARLILVGDPGQLASIEAGAVLGDIVGLGGDRDGSADRVSTHRRRSWCSTASIASAAGSRGWPPPSAPATAMPSWSCCARARGRHVARSSTSPSRTRCPPCPSPRWPPPGARSRPRGRAARATRSMRWARSGSYARTGAAPTAWRRGPRGWRAGWPPSWRTSTPRTAGTSAGPCSSTRTTTSCASTTGTPASSCRSATAGWRPRSRADEETIEHSPSRLGAVDTVYAMTVHKSQGSQFHSAAVLLPSGRAGMVSRILTRELLYTAATRAQRRLILAGTEESVRAAVARPVARASGLGRRLWGDLAT